MLIKSLALVLALSCAAFANQYQGIDINTTTGKAIENISGSLKIAVSSATSSTATITLDGANGINSSKQVTASSLTITGDSLIKGAIFGPTVTNIAAATTTLHTEVIPISRISLSTVTLAIAASTTGVTAGGDLTGTYPNPTLVAKGTAGTYGSATISNTITTDAQGRVIAMSSNTITTTANLTGLRYSTDTVSAGLITGTFTTISAANINGRAIQATGYPIYSLGSWYPGAGFYGQGVANGDKQSYGVHGIGWSTNGNKSAGIYGTWDTLDGTGGYAGYFDGDVVSTGPVTAPFFVGSASKLTGLPTLTGLRYSTDTVSVALIDLSTVTTAFQAVGLATQTIHTEIIPVSRINLSTCATSLTGLRYSTDTVSVALVDLSTITSAIALKANTDSPIFTGNVGINTTLPNPTYKLDVNGLVNCTGYYLNGAPFTGGSPVPTRQTFYSGTSATYTRPSSPAPRRICARIVGGGGAGACNNAAVGPSGSASTFNGISAGGGVGGFQYNNNGGLGGVGGSTVTTAGVNFGVPGGYGAEGSGSSLSQIFGGNGGTSCYGGSGSGSNSGSMNGLAGVPNTGAGGGGGSSGGGAGSGGGGAGGCLDYCINAPAATYTYTVGPGGAAPTGCSQGVGGAGATGVIIVDEYY